MSSAGAYSKGMSRRALSLLVLVAAASIAAAFQQAAFPPFVTTKNLYADTNFRGKKAPDFFIQKWLNRSEVDVRGKVVLIDFWATWCPPCRKAIPELNEFAKKFKDKLVVIGISDEPADTVSKFMDTTPMEYSVGIDTTKKMMKAIGVKGIPHALVVTPDGIVRWQGFPLDDDDRLTEKVLQQIIDASGVK